MATATLEKLTPVPRYPTLRTATDAAGDVHWCHMHADLAHAPGRACFKPALVDDILRYQQSLGERLWRERRQGDAGLKHVVLASDCDAFNLGGDLEYFCDAIRRQDRSALLHYATQCVRGVHAFHDGLGAGAHSIALVQGDALGGGFEAALSCHTIVAEEGVGMGLPEVLFGLFPGMGAYSFLCKRVSPRQAENMILSGEVYSSEEMYRLGVVDVLVPKGQGESAVQDLIRQQQRAPHSYLAMNAVRRIGQPVSYDELMGITEVWVDTALALGEKSLKTMDRIVRAQARRSSSEAAA